MNNHRDAEPDLGLYEGENPFAGEPNASRALSWERAHWKVKLQQQADRHRKELDAASGEREAMRAELAGALEACGAFPTFSPSASMAEQAAARTWPKLLALVGFFAGKASLPPPVIQVSAPAKARRAKR